MDRYAQEQFDADSPYAECFRAWLDCGLAGLDTFPTLELEENASVAQGHLNTPYHQGSTSLKAFASDLAAHIVERWEATDVDREYVEHRDGLAGGGR